MTCMICTPGAPQAEFCTKCLILWFETGESRPPYLARQARWRRREGFWPWGGARDVPTAGQLRRVQRLALPRVERGFEEER